MDKLIESATWSGAVLALFGLMMTGGFWLRHGQWIWEGLV